MHSILAVSLLYLSLIVNNILFLLACCFFLFHSSRSLCNCYSLFNTFIHSNYCLLFSFPPFPLFFFRLIVFSRSSIFLFVSFKFFNVSLSSHFSFLLSNVPLLFFLTYCTLFAFSLSLICFRLINACVHSQCIYTFFPNKFPTFPLFLYLYSTPFAFPSRFICSIHFLLVVSPCSFSKPFISILFYQP